MNENQASTEDIEQELYLWKMRAEERQKEIERLQKVIAEERALGYKLALRVIDMQDAQIATMRSP